MTRINPIFKNNEYTKKHTPYNQAEGTINTENNTKPLKPEGHLVTDNLSNSIKYYFKDIAYDLKSVKNGLSGNANDHQQGRLNDVGLKLGGIGIATVLASRTPNPMMRVMEYVGLGTFLAAMDIFPKIAIHTPANAIHGFDIGKEYIDDQGRKKSVFQDSNYIPYDMYLGETPDTDLDIIGDKLGIPRDINNRQELIKAQMRKIATQNNTWWMLTAGFATPILTALTCCGLEKVIAPAYEKLRNSHYDKKIAQLLDETVKMDLDLSKIKANNMQKSVESILQQYKGKQLPGKELDKVISIITYHLDSAIADGVSEDIPRVFAKEAEGFVIHETLADDIVNNIKTNIPKRVKNLIEKTFIPETSDVKEIFKKYESGIITEDDIFNIKNEFRKLFAPKINSASPDAKEFLIAYQNNILDQVAMLAKREKTQVLTDTAYNTLINISKIMGDYLTKDEQLLKCKSFKVGHAPETVLARGCKKFERTLLEVLDIKYKDLSLIRDSKQYAENIIDQKLTELAKDKNRHQKAIEKLTKVMSEIEITLHGSSGENSVLKDLIIAIENNHNMTAKRLDSLGSGKFASTIQGLVFEDINTLSNSVQTRQDLFDFLDGINRPKYVHNLDYVKENAKGVGTAKKHTISRIIERYQGVENSFRRIIHLFDFYAQEIPTGNYEKQLHEIAKGVLTNATSAQHTLKFNLVNNPEAYKDIMNMLFTRNLSESTRAGLSISKELADGNIIGRYESYLRRFFDIMGNNTIDFEKTAHVIDPNRLHNYTKSAQTRMSKFNLVSQTIMDFIQQASERKYGDQKWLRTFGIWGGAILGGTILTQFAFGRLDKPHKKQVSNVNNK